MKGFIVADNMGPLELVNPSRTFPEPVLLHGDYVTVFSTRARANRAIKASIAYAEKNEFRWDANYRIFIVRETEEARMPK